MSVELPAIARRISTSARRCDQNGYLILAPGDPAFDQSGYAVISRTLLWQLQEAIGLNSAREHVNRPDPNPESTAQLRALLRDRELGRSDIPGTETNS